jgi:hypothetical protein
MIKDVAVQDTIENLLFDSLVSSPGRENITMIQSYVWVVTDYLLWGELPDKIRVVFRFFLPSIFSRIQKQSRCFCVFTKPVKLLVQFTHV